MEVVLQCIQGRFLRETSRGRSDVHGDLVNVAQPTEAASMKALSRD